MSKQAAVIGIGRWLFLVAVLSVAATSPAQAQLGGLKKLKEKAEKTVGGKPAAQPQAQVAKSEQRSPYNERVLELTPQVAECFERSLAAENAELESYRKWASTVRSQEQYQSCQGEALMSPAGQKLSQEYMAALEGKEGQAAMSVMQAFAKKLDGFIEQSCGPKPDAVAQRKLEAKKSAAEKAQAECGLTADQYEILKERVAMVCGTGALASADGALMLPGEGQNIFWVFSATEVEVLKQKCGTLQLALKQVL